VRTGLLSGVETEAVKVAFDDIYINWHDGLAKFLER
jgi:hypothetical protein